MGHPEEQYDLDVEGAHEGPLVLDRAALTDVMAGAQGARLVDLGGDQVMLVSEGVPSGLTDALGRPLAEGWENLMDAEEDVRVLYLSLEGAPVEDLQALAERKLQESRVDLNRFTVEASLKGPNTLRIAVRPRVQEAGESAVA